jgi:TIR domain
MIEQSVVIQRPLFDVFDYLMDVDRFWEWAPYFLDTEVSKTDENNWPTLFKARVGLSWDLSIVSKVWISNVQRGKSITFRSEEPPQVATYTVEPTLSGTILTARHSPWPIFGMSSLQAPINVFMADYLNQALSNVKQTLEARPPTSRPVVFLSYRQQSTAEYSAGRIVEALSKEFGGESIFRDLATISAGQDADKAIEQGLQGCAAVIVLIHDQWLEAFKEKRENKERDYVLSEIKAAIAAEKAIIPVTLKEVSIEEVQRQLRQDQELKEISAPLSEKQWQQLRDDPDFTPDIRRITQSIWAAVIKGGKWERVIEGGLSQDSKTSRPGPALSESSWAQASGPSWAQLLSNFVEGWTQAVSIVLNRSRSRSRSTDNADRLP